MGVVSPAIFLSALARPGGYRVSRAPSASARYSLRRDAVHGVEESLGHGARGVLGVGSRGEGVGGLFGNDVDGRLGDARGDGQPLHYVVEARLFLLADRPGAGGTKDEPVAIAVGV